MGSLIFALRFDDPNLQNLFQESITPFPLIIKRFKQTKSNVVIYSILSKSSKCFFAFSL